YTANILGSLAGIALFTAATAMSSPPWVWLGVAGVALAATAGVAEGARLARAAAAGPGLGLPLPAPPPPAGTRPWAPLPKLPAHPRPVQRSDGSTVSCGDEVVVNGTFYQGIVDLDPEHHRAAPDLYPPGEIRRSHYVLPYEVIGARERVLVAGAGTGNDVAA